MKREEDKFENFVIEELRKYAYTYREDIIDRASLEKNFREKFNALNKVTLADPEFARLLQEIVTVDVFKASKTLRTQGYLERDDGTPLYYTLVNHKDWCKNSYEIINQARFSTDYSHHNYDVVILLNGVPVVHIELKSHKVSARNAIAQIVKYKKDHGSSYTRTLMCFVQLFIAANPNDTWYFANNNPEHFNFDAEERFLPVYKFAKRDNSKVIDFASFAADFLNKCNLGQTISRYIVLVETEKKLVMMRPYQTYAVKEIVRHVKEGVGNGYIWHTTGSGKTLTSFKAATLLRDNDKITKCLFVVDRKDLDRQTRAEFNRFQEGCVERNTSTKNLVERLLSPNYKDKVIVTTIQKLGIALSSEKKYKERLKPLRDKRMVFIFDECHRSQFGDNHQAIKEFFPNAQLFGFTGTPIFQENASDYPSIGRELRPKTTKEVFQHQLHTYTIANAIDDGNVLGFHIDYYAPPEVQKPKPGTMKAQVVQTILEKHGSATGTRRFNALFATNSINDAIEYYDLFKQQQQARINLDSDFEPLRIAGVFSPPPGTDRDADHLRDDLATEREEYKGTTEEHNRKQEALEGIIADFNEQFATNHAINAFDRYYQDIQTRIKDQQNPKKVAPSDKRIDITIVVDMLLTGFDARYLNTLYVDKNLRYHGLIQAFSRTNRVLNATKPFGNIVGFCLDQAVVQEAVALFSNSEADAEAQSKWFVADASEALAAYTAEVAELKKFFGQHDLDMLPSSALVLRGDTAKLGFLTRFKNVQTLKTNIDFYPDLTSEQKQEINSLIPQQTMEGLRTSYLDLARDFRKRRQNDKDREDKPTNSAPPIETVDAELVLFASDIIDYDYIMELMARYSSEQPSARQVTIKDIKGVITSHSNFMDNREDLVAYLESLTPGAELSEQQIKDGYEAFVTHRHAGEVISIAEKFGLHPEALQDYVAQLLGHKVFHDSDLTELFRPVGLGWRERSHRKKEMMREHLIPLLLSRTGGNKIRGLEVYDD